MSKSPYHLHRQRHLMLNMTLLMQEKKKERLKVNFESHALKRMHLKELIFKTA